MRQDLNQKKKVERSHQGKEDRRGKKLLEGKNERPVSKKEVPMFGVGTNAQHAAVESLKDDRLRGHPGRTSQPAALWESRARGEGHVSSVERR